jgi:regulator of protease activity HflC (stomatin/prohibitin superfamily)
MLVKYSLNRIGGIDMINPINPSSREPIGKPVEKNIVKEPSEVKNENNTGVTLEIGSKVDKTATYSNVKTSKPDVKAIEQLQKQADDALAPLRQMVEALLKEQGLAFNRANKKESKEKLVEITPEIRAEAQRLVADGGEYSIENTSTRLVDFAKAISGGDKSKIDALREAIKKGYAEAQKAFGGELPEVSVKTLEMTMKKLDEWQNS